jgi:hypothetical protein
MWSVIPETGRVTNRRALKLVGMRGVRTVMPRGRMVHVGLSMVRGGKEAPQQHTGVLEAWPSKGMRVMGEMLSRSLDVQVMGLMLVSLLKRRLRVPASPMLGMEATRVHTRRSEGMEERPCNIWVVEGDTVDLQKERLGLGCLVMLPGRFNQEFL